ncbi:hypothetical protein VCRA2110O319_10080 [Vibrio crassostreae]|nr:hypothetical protein VCRA2110O319_10080 [Vibrio crassostreae]
MFHFVIKEFSIKIANSQWFLRKDKGCLFFELTFIKQWFEFVLLVLCLIFSIDMFLRWLSSVYQVYFCDLC